ncbi:MAG TPA: G1 family glutamic endopeptidase, partial [Chloroflexota bacterium]|nr:G1 family glutamic endopeptidase [Chloroflexota bacterium]
MIRLLTLSFALLLAAPQTAFAQTLPPINQLEPTENWSGYVANNAYYTGVTALMEAPRPDLLQVLGTAFSWVGIGGTQSNDLIQAGIAEVNQGPFVSYAAWYEMLPAPPLLVPVQVAAGSWVLVDIHQVGFNRWQISVVNGTSTFVQQFTYASSHTSAEWILEAPAILHNQQVAGFLPLAGVAGANFAKMSAIANGVNAIPTQLFPKPSALIGPSGRAVPTALGPDGASFTV